MFAGWLFDATDNYDVSFWVMGAAIAVSGVMLYPIPAIQKRQLKKSEMSDELRHDVDMGKKVGSSSDLPQKRVLIDEVEVTA